ncbi:MAG: hypothetical protein NTY05_07935 [Rhodocyclales bacterium]|nr:hypothetical protein [Rhodocyclales bacterium]
MRSVAATRLSLLTGAWLLSAVGAVNAGEAGRLESPGIFLLAEIVVPAQQDSGKKTAKSAAEVRGKAKAYQESGSASPTIIVLPEEEEEGLLGPRRQPESGASQSRAKARQYQQGSAQVPIPATPDSSNPGATNAERAQGNRAKARSYVSTDNTVVIERIGSDGIPIVSCGKLIANVAGRIGDDMQPGGIFFVMRDNKPFKVRCALQ